MWCSTLMSASVRFGLMVMYLSGLVRTTAMSDVNIYCKQQQQISNVTEYNPRQNLHSEHNNTSLLLLSFTIALPRIENRLRKTTNPPGISVKGWMTIMKHSSARVTGKPERASVSDKSERANGFLQGMGGWRKPSTTRRGKV